MNLSHVLRARKRISSIVHHTPLESWPRLSREMNCDVSLKLECFQTTGSFKIRGAMAKLSTLTAKEKASGVLTVSAGNHGLGVAHCAEVFNLDATIVVPLSASAAKIRAIRRYPVTLIEEGEDYNQAERAARLMEQETGKTFVSPYNDLDVIAGQATVGIEILEDDPSLEAIVVPVGGGGLLAGVLIAVKAMKPGIEVYGVESTASPTMTAALSAGRIVEIAEQESIADGLAGNIEPDAVTFPLIQKMVDGTILVSEAAIRMALAGVAREDHIMIEGSAAASVAALGDERLRGKRCCAIVTGRNITLELFNRVIEAV